MPKPTMPSTSRVRREAPVDATAQEVAERNDAHGLARQEEARLRSPQEFYVELTRRPDVRAFLKRLADR